MHDTQAPEERTFVEAGFSGLFVIWGVIGAVALVVGGVVWASTGELAGLGVALFVLATSVGCLLISRLARA